MDRGSWTGGAEVGMTEEMRERMIGLAERCEAATGANYDLDCDIARFAFRIPTATPKPFTASIDAAMSLVPSHMDWQYSSATGTANVFDRDKKTFGHTDTDYPSLALCAAAIRARFEERK